MATTGSFRPKPTARLAVAHHDVVLLVYDEISQRRFAGWTMGQVNMARINTAMLLKYSERPSLDPYSVSGRVTMALFEELLATAAVVGDR